MVGYAGVGFLLGRVSRRFSQGGLHKYLNLPFVVPRVSFDG